MATIHWSILAKEDYWNNIDYLLSEWTQDEALSFIENVDQYLNIIAKKPKTFKSTGYRNVHVVPIVSQISLFYRIVDKNNVELVRFWNNHRNPEKLKL